MNTPQSDTHFQRMARFDPARSLAPLAAAWNADSTPLQRVNEGINITYRFTVQGKTGYLKIVHAAGRDDRDVAASQAFLAHLHAEGAPVNPPWPTRDGAWYASIEQDADRYVACAVGAVPGEVLPETMLPLEQWRAWGATLGRLHRAASTFQAGAHRYTDWAEVWAALRALLEPADEPAWREFEAVDAFFRMLQPTPPSYGLTHFDFRAGNMLRDGDTVWAIDFDDMVYHWWMADVARPFIEISDAPLEERQAALAAFAAGYRAHFPLGDDWLATLPWFIRMKRMDFYAWDLVHWDPTRAESRAEFQARYHALFANPTVW